MQGGREVRAFACLYVPSAPHSRSVAIKKVSSPGIPFFSGSRIAMGRERRETCKKTSAADRTEKIAFFGLPTPPGIWVCGLFSSLRAVAEETIRVEAKWRIAVGSALSSSSDRSSQLFYGQGEAVFPPPATTFFFLWRASLPRQQSDLLLSLSPPLAAIFWVDEQRHPR